MATAPGGCSTQWLSLNAAVAGVRTNDGNRNDVIYYGLLPNGVPIANVGGWEQAGSDESLQFALQFSKDEGNSWNGLAVGLTGNGFRFTTAELPSGRVIFRVLAHDGFFTATAVSPPVDLPERPATVSILHPHPDQPVLEGLPLRLWAAVGLSTGEMPDSSLGEWLIDGQRVGSGLETWIAAPQAGRHRCTFIFEGPGGRVEQTAEFGSVHPSTLDRQLQPQ